MTTYAAATPADQSPSSASSHGIEPPKARPAFGILAALSGSHMINDMMQSLILAMYPILKGDFALSFAQIGLITLTYQLTASLLQPLVGLFTDRRPQPYSLPLGMVFTLIGLMLLAFAPSFEIVLLAAAFVGMGSSIFHPESSRIARLASGGQHGFAQSVFQVGGNTGTAIGPLVAAAVIVPFGQRSVAWFGVAVAVGIALLIGVGRWYSAHHVAAGKRKSLATAAPVSAPGGPGAIAVLLVLIFSKYFYVAGISSFYTFYLMEHFGLTVQSAQLHLFIFLFASAVGTVAGGPVGDRVGRKPVIWFSILGVAPFALLLPHADLFWTDDPDDRDRAGSVLGLLGDPGLRAGTDAGQGRHGVGPVLRFRVRHGRTRRRGAWHLRRPDQHPFRVPDHRLPPAAGRGGDTPAKGPAQGLTGPIPRSWPVFVAFSAPECRRSDEHRSPENHEVIWPVLVSRCGSRRLSSEKSSEQALRLQRHRMATATSLLVIVLLLAATLLGELPREAFVASTLAIAFWVLVFYGAFRSGLNQRFKDPSLTLPQMLAATLVVLATMYWAGSGRGIFPLLLLMVFLFGVMRFDTRTLMGSAIVVLVGYGLVVASLWYADPQREGLAQELLQWLALALVLPWFVWMGGYMKGLRRQLHKRNAELEEAQRIARIGMWIVDPVARSITWSAEVYRLFGLDASKGVPVGREFTRLIHPEDRQHYRKLIRPSLVEGRNLDSEFRVVLPSGGVRWLHALGRPVIERQRSHGTGSWHAQGHHGATRGGCTHPAPRAFRRIDGLAQPQPLLPSAGEGTGPGHAAVQALGRSLHRPRRLQAGQRPARP